MFEIRKDDTYLDGKPFRLYTGAIHYFRIHPSDWERRLTLMKDFGLTAASVYVPWNLHERHRGEFDFTGHLDLAAFLECAAKVGLKVLLRPSPYICSECDMGGLPPFLLKNKDMVLRSSDPAYLAEVERWYDVLCPVFTPYLETNGGPIVLCCLENEYGGYGTDREYLRKLADIMRVRGVDVPLYTTDWYKLTHQYFGNIDGVWKAVNYRTESERSINALKKIQQDKAPYVGELWTGRSMNVEEPYFVRELAPVTDSFEKALALGAGVDIYMFCGGTNFGDFAGATYGRGFEPREESYVRYLPMMQSYDVDAPIGEDGNVTEKYYELRDVLDRHLGRPVRERNIPRKEYQVCADIMLTKTASLLASFAEGEKHARPLRFEDAGSGYGFMIYRTAVEGVGVSIDRKLKLFGLNDSADVYVNGKLAGNVKRDRGETELVVHVPADGASIELIVENSGRIGFGPKINESKGFDYATIDTLMLFNWESTPVCAEDILTVKGGNAECDGAAIFDGEFEAKAGVDAYLNVEGLCKGYLFINGFFLGRYMQNTSQKTLYVPGGLLTEHNTVRVMEQYPHASRGVITFSDQHILTGEPKKEEI
ncbi:MAG: beta-galactosidase [Clostridia bacterium]|nr:beta-galactosidase [Clostridia bacterium]